MIVRLSPIAFLLALPCACVAATSGHCERRFDKAELQELIRSILHIPVYEFTVNWKDCRYYMAVWPKPVTPDTQVILVLDENGRLIDGPR